MLGAGLALALLPGCAGPKPEDEAALRAKIRFDLDALNADGLVGGPGSLRALDYEFCIPADEARLAEVRRIDPSVRVMRHSRGRIGCGPGQWLCLGNTHQPNARAILLRLAALPYLERIEQTVWE